MNTRYFYFLIFNEQLNLILSNEKVLGISWMAHMFENGMPMILGDQVSFALVLMENINYLALCLDGIRKDSSNYWIFSISP